MKFNRVQGTDGPEYKAEVDSITYTIRHEPGQAHPQTGQWWLYISNPAKIGAAVVEQGFTKGELVNLAAEFQRNYGERH